MPVRVMVVSSANFFKLRMLEIPGQSFMFTRTNIGRKILPLGTHIAIGLIEKIMPI